MNYRQNYTCHILACRITRHVTL